MSRSSNFKRVCSEWHPKLVRLVGRADGRTTLRNVVYDSKSNEWISHTLSGLPWAFDIWASNRIMYSCDGGLVCFVPQADLLSYPILVDNPLTNEWKALPRIPFEYKINLVQLVMEEDTNCYRVILVCGERHGEDYAANCYDSRTGEWSCMESGIVYGNCSFLFDTGMVAPRVFDCTTKTMYKLVNCSSLTDLGFKLRGCTMVKDRLFVLHDRCQGFKVSEYTWQRSTSDLSFINSILPEYLPIVYDVYLFASGGFILLLAHYGDEDEHEHQLIRLYDSFANDGHSLSISAGIRFTRGDLQSVYMCHLRWDAVP